jgi:hypothetical protein
MGNGGHAYHKKNLFRISLIVQARKRGLHASRYVRMVVSMIWCLTLDVFFTIEKIGYHIHDVTARLIKNNIEKRIKCYNVGIV